MTFKNSVNWGRFSRKKVGRWMGPLSNGLCISIRDKLSKCFQVRRPYPCRPACSSRPLMSAKPDNSQATPSGIALPRSFFSFQNQLADSAVIHLARMKWSCEPFSSLINRKEEHKNINKATLPDSSWFLTSYKGRNTPIFLYHALLPSS